MDSFGKLILLVVLPFLVGFYGVRYYNTTQDPQVRRDQTVQPKPQVQTSIETGRIKCIDHNAVYCNEYVILKIVKE